MVSEGVVGSTRIFWKRRSNAPSFSMYWRYSSKVVEPMHCNSPRAKAGLNMLLASNEPLALPAPTKVWISSTKRMMSRLFSNSLRMALIRSSNWPRYLVPATMEPMSSMTTRLSNKVRGTRCCTMRMAKPSAMADLPTPGSPINIGLFFLRRLRIWAMRSNSRSRPTMGSRRLSSAALVRSRPKLSKTGVLLFAAGVFLGFSCCGLISFIRSS